jgi:hypothetical protein
VVDIMVVAVVRPLMVQVVVGRRLLRAQPDFSSLLEVELHATLKINAKTMLNHHCGICPEGTITSYFLL